MNTEYKVVEARGRENFEDKCNRMAAEGWDSTGTFIKDQDGYALLMFKMSET